MKTAGCEIWDSYLAAGFRRADGTWTPTRTIAPEAFWSRLKDAITRAGLMADFRADEQEVRKHHTGHDVEIMMFRRWVERLGIDVPAGHYPGEKLWPWSRGWTEAAVDAYLVAPVRRAA